VGKSQLWAPELKRSQKEGKFQGNFKGKKALIFRAAEALRGRMKTGRPEEGDAADDYWQRCRRGGSLGVCLSAGRKTGTAREGDCGGRCTGTSGGKGAQGLFVEGLFIRHTCQRGDLGGERGKGEGDVATRTEVDLLTGGSKGFLGMGPFRGVGRRGVPRALEVQWWWFGRQSLTTQTREKKGIKRYTSLRSPKECIGGMSDTSTEENQCSNLRGCAGLEVLG